MKKEIEFDKRTTAEPELKEMKKEDSCEVTIFDAIKSIVNKETPTFEDQTRLIMVLMQLNDAISLCSLFSALSSIEFFELNRYNR